MHCISPTPLSKLLSDFLLYCFFSGCKTSVSSPKHSSCKLPCPDPPRFCSIFACWSLGSQPYKSSSRLQGKKSPFQFPTFAGVWVCGEDPSYLVHSFTSSTSEQTGFVWNSHENNSNNSSFPLVLPWKMLKGFYFKKLSFQSNIFSWYKYKIIFWFFKK